MIPEAKRPGALELEITRTGGGSAPALRVKGVRAVKGAPESVITLAGERLYPRKAEEAEFRFHISRLYEKADGILIDVMLDYMDGRGSGTVISHLCTAGGHRPPLHPVRDRA